MAKINGGDGNDILYGTRNADVIDGGGRRDYIYGGDGNDFIIGGLGNDILSGGRGIDTFYFGHLHDADLIQDFQRGDVIALDASIDSYFITQEWNGVRIATVDLDYTADVVQGSIVLSGVTQQQWLSWGGVYGSGLTGDRAGLIDFGFNDVAIA